MFRDVVVEGTGTEAAIPGYTVAGKTGTANKAENGVYVSKYVASFVGLVPLASRGSRSCDGRRAARADLRRRRRGSDLPRHRAVRAPVPRGAAGRARVEAVVEPSRRRRRSVGARTRPYNRSVELDALIRALAPE